jgi:hypothetical protein
MITANGLVDIDVDAMYAAQEAKACTVGTRIGRMDLHMLTYLKDVRCSNFACKHRNTKTLTEFQAMSMKVCGFESPDL